MNKHVKRVLVMVLAAAMVLSFAAGAGAIGFGGGFNTVEEEKPSDNPGTPGTNKITGTIVNVDSYVNFRTKASTGADRVAGCPQLKKGWTVTILETLKGWYKVEYGTYQGYVSNKYVKLNSANSGGGNNGGGTGDTSYTRYDQPKTGISKDSAIYIRKAPGSSDYVVIKSAKGKSFELLGESGSWYYARYNGNEGYVRMQDFTISTGSNNGGSTPPPSGGTNTGGGLGNSNYTGTAADAWGRIVQIPGTNIGTAYNKLYDNNIYNNSRNSKGEFYYNAYNGTKNYFYAVSPLGSQISVIMGHNMRSSLTGFHYLHHVQNAWLGISKCEKCKKTVESSAKSDVFYIDYEGHSRWKVLGFYEVDGSNTNATQRAAIKKFAALNFGLKGSGAASWAEQQLAYAGMKGYKGKVLNSSVSSNDQFMILITCADMTSGSDGNHALYFILKAM